MSFLEKITAGIIEANAFNNFACWMIPTGAGFMSDEKWWGGGGKRPSPHQGIDLLAWRDRRGNIIAMGPDTLVPEPRGGVIVNILPDFIGKSVFLLAIEENGAMTLHLYGHLKTTEGLSPGQRIEKDTIIGRVASPAEGRKVRPHLHISIARVCEEIDFSTIKISWDNLDSLPIELRDPALDG